MGHLPDPDIIVFYVFSSWSTSTASEGRLMTAPDRHGLRLVAVVVAVLLVTSAAPGAATTSPPNTVVPIDGRGDGRVFDGVGAVSAGGSSRLLVDYPRRQREQILDYLFRPKYGASLQVLKIEIGADTDTTAGAEPSHMRSPDEVDCTRGYEWWLAEEARKRNPNLKLYALQWGSAGWLRDGFWSDDNIRYVLSWLDCAAQHGLRVDYLGGGNERGWDAGYYVKLAAALDEHGYGDIQVVASDDHSPPDYWAVATDMRDDPAFTDAVDVLGEHDICEWRTLQQRCHVSDDALATGKPLWDSENSTQDIDVGQEPLARAMNRHYIDAKVTGNLNWALVSGWYGSWPVAGTGLVLADRPWSGYYRVGPSVWVDAHTTQFTEPGWRYLDDASGYLPGGASYVTLRSQRTGDYTTVIETLDQAAPARVEFEVGGGLDTGPAHLWATNLRTATADDDFVNVGTIAPRDGVTLEPGHVYTISTTTGQTKGGAYSPADPGSQLGLPYREDFERTGADRLARYFSDIHGGYEAAACAGGRTGTCYRQAVPQEPELWHGASMPPTTLTGDPTWWGDYEVSADALLDATGYVELLGRVESQQHTAAGYHLRVTDTGAWRLYTQDASGQDTDLASGTTAPVPPGTWHRLTLTMRGTQIVASLDGNTLATVTDDSHTTGQVGFRTSPWQHAQFDDLRVTPTGPAPDFLPHDRMSATATSEHAENDHGFSYAASRAIDDRVETAWRSEYQPVAPLPQSITLDLGEDRKVFGLAYRPGVTGTAGAITGYRVWLSADGKTFTEVDAGYWKASIATKMSAWSGQRARFVRLEATDVAGCPRAGLAAELEVATSPVRPLGQTDPPPPDVPAFDHYVPTAEMTATATSAQPGYEAGRAIDGDCSTMWHSSWSPPQPLPQSLTLDLGKTRDVLALVYQPRQDGTANGIVRDFRISASTDGQTFTEVASGQWANDARSKVAQWDPLPARYLRLDALTGVNGHVSAAELAIAEIP
jgi:glycosyl hydrolase family 59/F5/8 type C domain-containing protein/glycosyl hydrolase family 59 (putative galactocerebrosidase)